jgi:hypothetical protein
MFFLLIGYEEVQAVLGFARIDAGGKMRRIPINKCL